MGHVRIISLLLLLPILNLGASGSMEEFEFSNFEIGSVIKRNNLKRQFMYQFSENMPYFYFQIAIDDECYEFITLHPEQILKDFRGNIYKYQMSSVIDPNIFDQRVERGSLFMEVMEMNKSDIFSTFFFEDGNLKILEYESYNSNKEFIMALIRKGFIPFLGDESGYLGVRK